MLSDEDDRASVVSRGSLRGEGMRSGTVPLRFFSVNFITPNDPDCRQLAELITRQHRQAGIDQFAISCPINPQGAVVGVRPKFMGQQLLKLRTLITDPGIKLGVLLQQTIGHSAVWNSNSNQALHWQRTVTLSGAPSVRFCPLDKGFQEYIRSAVRTVCAFGPDFVVFDDDVRLYIQREVECFCPEHVARFNLRTGAHYTAESLKAAITSAPGGSRLLREFSAERDQTVVEFLTMIREEIDAINPQASGTLCTVATQYPVVSRLARAVSGAGHPVSLRVGSGQYCERALRELNWVHHIIGVQRAALKHDVDEFLDEADTCPHNRFSKSARTMHLHLVTALLTQIDGAKLWLTPSIAMMPDRSLRYEKILGEHKDFYRELHRVAKMARFAGPLVTIPQQDPHPEFPGQYVNAQDWGRDMLSGFGIPFDFATSDVAGAHLLTGSQLDYFTDEELKGILSRRVLLDGTAAAGLVKRGMGGFLGVNPSPMTSHVSGEYVEGEEYCIRPMVERRYDLRPAKEAEVLSRFYDVDYSERGMRMQPMNPSAIRFCNSLGGTVVISANAVGSNRLNMNPERQQWCRMLLQKLDALPACLIAEQDTLFRWGYLPDGSVLAAVINLSYDYLEQVTIRCHELAETVQALSAKGDWEPIDFDCTHGVLTIPRRLESSGLMILKIRKK